MLGVKVEIRMVVRDVFSAICKGSIVLSKYKTKQHEKRYGLWDPKEVSEGPLTAKKFRVGKNDSSNPSDTESNVDQNEANSGGVSGDLAWFVSDHDHDTMTSNEVFIVMTLIKIWARYTCLQIIPYG